jgi:hypothetical protein
MPRTVTAEIPGESGMAESDVQGLGIEAVLFEGPERQL